jgi:hypothetical protein
MAAGGAEPPPVGPAPAAPHRRRRRVPRRWPSPHSSLLARGWRLSPTMAVARAQHVGLVPGFPSFLHAPDGGWMLGGRAPGGRRAAGPSPATAAHQAHHGGTAILFPTSLPLFALPPTATEPRGRRPDGPLCPFAPATVDWCCARRHDGRRQAFAPEGVTSFGRGGAAVPGHCPCSSSDASACRCASDRAELTRPCGGVLCR